MSFSDIYLDDVRAALRSDAAGVAIALLGEPNKTASSRSTLRWGSKGSLAVEVQGPKRGLWYSHEADTGKDMIALIRQERGCTFAEAISWAGSWTGLTPEFAHDDDSDAQHRADRENERAKRRAEETAKVADDVAKRIAFAQRIATACIPVAGTLGDIYLRQTRGIPPGPNGWPGAVQYHPGYRALVVIATTEAGVVQAVQRVHLANDGGKVDAPEIESRRLPAVKVTNGVLADAVVRLPGDPNGPLLLAEGPETGLSVWAATQHEVWITLGKSNIAKVPAPHGRRVVVCAEYGKVDGYLDDEIAAWRDAGIDAVAAWPWAKRPTTGTDFNDLLLKSGVAAVKKAINEACALLQPSKPDPHYPRPLMGFDAASGRLRKVVAAWFDRVELYLNARDWRAAELDRLTPELLPALMSTSYARILAAMLRKSPGIDPIKAEEEAAKRARAAAKRMLRYQVKQAAVAKFGRHAVTGNMPRIQITGAAGLGKSQAVIAEYVRRPKLWGLHVNVFVRDLNLAADFANDVQEAIARIAPVPDGVLPRVQVIQGRGHPGMCHPDRYAVVEQVQPHVDSVYRACCLTPATDTMPEIRCPFYATCGYIEQFKDKRPALRIMPHQRLGTLQADDLRLPPADLVIVDESAIGALVVSSEVDPATLTDRSTYFAPAGKEDLIQEAVDVGAAVIAALSGEEPAVSTLRGAGMSAKLLRDVADAAGKAADAARLSINPSMSAIAIARRMAGHKHHPGRAVAAIYSQLARDLENDRTSSIGIEFDAKATATTDAGAKVAHPLILRHGLAPTYGAPGGTALLAIDADAILDVNRRIFGPSLRGFTINAVRQAHVIQVSDAAVAKSTVAPDSRLTNNQDKAKALRNRIAKLVARETRDARKVLVIAPLKVRCALTGEVADKVAVWTEWNSAEVTHFGRHLGVNRWSAFDTVIVVGREQLPPLVAEHQARAIYADDPGVTLSLTGEYTKSQRRHDMRHGTAAPVTVQVHADPRVQDLVELVRERAMGQGIDRLRLVRRDEDKPGRVIVVSNLPVPGIVVDEFMTLDHVLDGGTPIQLAVENMKGGVLPLSPEWLKSKLSVSLRTAAQWASEVECKSAIYVLHCHIAFYSCAGQFRPSKALVRVGTADPRAELERLLGKSVTMFRLDVPEASHSMASSLPVPQSAESEPAPSGTMRMVTSEAPEQVGLDPGSIYRSPIASAWQPPTGRYRLGTGQIIEDRDPLPFIRPWLLHPVTPAQAWSDALDAEPAGVVWWGPLRPRPELGPELARIAFRQRDTGGLRP